MTADEQAVRIDAIGCTGDKRAEVAPLNNFKIRDLRRFYNADLIYLIGKDFIQHTQHKNVTLLELIQIGKKLCAGETSMPRKDAVATCTANRETGPFEMPHSNLQNGLLRPMVNWETHIEIWNLDIAHDTEAGYIQQLLILGLLVLRQSKAGISLG